MLGLLLVISMIWLFVKRKNVWGMRFYFITVAGGGLLNLLLKNFFDRERPNVNISSRRMDLVFLVGIPWAV